MLATATRIVIKVGSSLITDEATGQVRAEWLAAFGQDIAMLAASGQKVILVTSGAIALGRRHLGLRARSLLQLEEKQAAAACGQITLYSAWREALGAHGITIGQVLLTADDSIQRHRYLNARNTIDTLLELGAVPIINENDTVATAEIRFGDNDRLSARVAQMAGADVLVLLSDIDGLYTANPNQNPAATLVEDVPDITPEIERMGGGATSTVGSGGMITKIGAAKIATSAGCHMIIARGTGLRPVKALLDGARCTRFLARETPLSARKHWIAGTVHPSGSIIVDDGAARALRAEKSLLPAGVVGVEGVFDRGDTVLIKDRSGTVIGKGLVSYGVGDASRILGRRSEDIEGILGFKRRDVLIHRDDLVLD